MSKRLNDEQKEKIETFLLSDKRTPAEETIGDSIKKLLKLSADDYEILKEEINDFAVSFFDKRISQN